MLVLSRKKNQSIDIGGQIRVTIIEAGNNTVKIGIEAPRDIPILRSELKTAAPHEKSQPATGVTEPPTAAVVTICEVSAQRFEDSLDVAL